MPASETIAMVSVAASSGERWFKPARPEMSSVARCRMTSVMTKKAAITVNT